MKRTTSLRAKMPTLTRTAMTRTAEAWMEGWARTPPPPPYPDQRVHGNARRGRGEAEAGIARKSQRTDRARELSGGGDVARCGGPATSEQTSNGVQIRSLGNAEAEPSAAGETCLEGHQAHGERRPCPRTEGPAKRRRLHQKTTPGDATLALAISRRVSGDQDDEAFQQQLPRDEEGRKSRSTKCRAEIHVSRIRRAIRSENMSRIKDPSNPKMDAVLTRSRLKSMKEKEPPGNVTHRLCTRPRRSIEQNMHS